MRLSLSLPSQHARALDVVVSGENSVDVLGRVAQPAKPGGKGLLQSLDMFCGGQAATAAIACARLGWRTRYVGVLGDDESAGRVEEALAAAGVTADPPRRRGVPGRAAIVTVDGTGERTVLEHRHPSLSMTDTEIAAACAAVETARLLLVDGTDSRAALALADAARRAKAPVIIDVDRADADAERLLAAADVIVVPRAFAETVSGVPAAGQALRALFARFRPALAVATLGPEGALAFDGSRECLVPAPLVDVVDSTGAGDAFRAGFAGAWLERGADAEVEWVLRFANAVAALNCRAPGAQGGLPRRADLEPYL